MKSTTFHPIFLPTPYPVGDITCWLIDGPQPVLVDAGVWTPQSLTALDRGLAAHGRSRSDLSAIWLTHHHQDHAGAAYALSRELQIPVCASERTFLMLDHQAMKGSPVAEFLMRVGVPTETLEAWRLFRKSDRFSKHDEPPFQTRTLSDGESLRVGDVQLQVFATPGHTPDHLVFVSQEQRVLIAGDLILHRITPNPLLNFDPLQGFQRTRSLLDYLASLQRMEPFAHFRILPGHGDEMSSAVEAISRAKGFVDKRSTAYLKLLRDHGPQTVFQLAQAHFGQRTPPELYLCVSETIAHLDLLEARGQASVAWDAPVISAQAL